MSPRSDLVTALMEEFAVTTGLTGDAPVRRYLWTDAFAVCNFLGLHRSTGASRYLDLALTLVDQVHHTLGRHREDDPRRGWISGLSDEEAELHPTRGGLRIGKRLPERGPDEPFDSRLEWERDGQYFHYLTRWIHALGRASQETGQEIFQRWAVELALAAHEGFVRAAPGAGAKHMAWKMSIDLSRPLVPSMGHHDPLDALVTYLELTATLAGAERGEGPLANAIADADAMCARGNWGTDDPLGIGGLLVDAGRVAELCLRHGVDRRELLATLLDDARASLAAFARSQLLNGPVQARLAFRELGLAIGLHAIERVRRMVANDPVSSKLDALAGYLPLAFGIEALWSEEASRRGRSWTDHREINMVMLATSLSPDGYLGA